MATNEPMTAERLAVIRAMLSLTDLGETQHQVISGLMHEVERLTLLNTHHDEVEREMRQQLAEDARCISAMFPFVEAVAMSGDAEDFRVRAMYALNYHVYASDEMRQQARAFVAAHPATVTAGEVESEEED